MPALPKSGGIVFHEKIELRFFVDEEHETRGMLKMHRAGSSLTQIVAKAAKPSATKRAVKVRN